MFGGCLVILSKMRIRTQRPCSVLQPVQTLLLREHWQEHAMVPLCSGCVRQPCSMLARPFRLLMKACTVLSSTQDIPHSMHQRHAAQHAKQHAMRLFLHGFQSAIFQVVFRARLASCVLAVVGAGCSHITQHASFGVVHSHWVVTVTSATYTDPGSQCGT